MLQSSPFPFFLCKCSKACANLRHFNWILYLPVYKSTFYDQKYQLKKSPLTYTWVIHKNLTQTIQEISVTIPSCGNNLTKQHGVHNNLVAYDNFLFAFCFQTSVDRLGFKVSLIASSSSPKVWEVIIVNLHLLRLHYSVISLYYCMILTDLQ